MKPVPCSKCSHPIYNSIFGWTHSSAKAYDHIATPKHRASSKSTILSRIMKAIRGCQHHNRVIEQTPYYRAIICLNCDQMFNFETDDWDAYLSDLRNLGLL